MFACRHLALFAIRSSLVEVDAGQSPPVPDSDATAVSAYCVDEEERHGGVMVAGTGGRA